MKDKKQDEKEFQDALEKRLRKIRAELEDVDKATDAFFSMIMGGEPIKKQEQQQQQQPNFGIDDVDKLAAVLGPREAAKIVEDKRLQSDSYRSDTPVTQQTQNEPFDAIERENDDSVRSHRTPKTEESQIVRPHRTGKYKIVRSGRTLKIQIVRPHRTADEQIVRSDRTVDSVTEQLNTHTLRQIVSRILSMNINQNLAFKLVFLILTYGLKFKTTFSQLADVIGVSSKSTVANFLNMCREHGTIIETNPLHTYIDFTPMFSDILMGEHYENVTRKENEPVYMFYYLKKYKTYLRTTWQNGDDLPSPSEVLEKAGEAYVIKDREFVYSLLAPLILVDIIPQRINSIFAIKVLDSLIEDRLYPTIAYMLHRKSIHNSLAFLVAALDNNYAKGVADDDIDRIKEFARAYYLISKDEFIDLYSVLELRHVLSLLNPVDGGVLYKTRADYINRLKEIRGEIDKLIDKLLSKVNIKSLEEYFREMRKTPLGRAGQ